LTLLDRYLARTFAKVFVGAFLILAVSAVAIDFVSRIGYFLNPEHVEGTFAEDYSSVRIILLFYVAHLPFLLKEMIPFVTVGSGLLTVTHMLQRNEVFPVVAAGVSVRRVFLPLFLGGALVAAGHLAFQEFVVPSLTQEQIALKHFFYGNRSQGVSDLPHLRDGKGTVTVARAFRFADRSLADVVVQRPWTAAGFDRWIIPRLAADGATWKAADGLEVQPADVAALPRALPPGTPVDIGVTPGEVEALASKKGTSELSFTQLARLARKFPERRNLRMALYKQVARPLSSVVLLLCGVPILLGAGRSHFLGVAIAFGLSACYYFLDIFFTSLGDRGDLPTLFAAWFPLATLLSLGIARLFTVPT